MKVWSRQMHMALGLITLWLCFVVAQAAAAAPYELDPLLSLTGNCATSTLDPIPDPPPPCAESSHPPSGRFNRPRSVAFDDFGNEFVAVYGSDGKTGRIDVFDDEGKFITELFDPNGPMSVAVDSQGNLYAFERAVEASGRITRYTPTVYKPESGEITYDNPPVVVFEGPDIPFNGGLAIDTVNDHLFIGLGGSIREYGSADEVLPEEGNKLFHTITNEKFASVTWVAVDAQRKRLYASFCKNEVLDCGVLVLEADAPYGLLEEIDGSEVPLGEFRSTKGWLSIAVDEETGDFFVDDLELTRNLYRFNEDYEYLETLTSSGFQGGDALQIAVSNAPAAFNHRYLFVPVVVASGRVLAFAPPTIECPPEIEDATANSIAETEAELRATIDSCGSETRYVFEYVTETQFEAEGFSSASIGGEGTFPGAKLPQHVSALLDGLAPGTAFRYRVFAENKAGDDELEGAFSTYADAVAANDCPNQLLRIGLSARLPDCRAYELVSPPDTNGRPPKGLGFSGDLFSTSHASPLGEAVSFAVEGGSLPGKGGAGGWHGDPYRSSRGASGWSTVGNGPSGTDSTIPLPAGVSPDQGHSFWASGGEGSAVEGGHYVHYPDGHSELIGRGSLGTDPGSRGMLITENASHIIFQTINIAPTVAQQLEENAPPTGTTAVYDRTADEVTHVVSLLPGNITPAAGQNASYVGASADGNGIAFSIGKKLYLRVGNAATYEIGEDVDFAGISEGGERIFYVEGGDLLAFDTNSKEVIAFSAVGNAVPVNVAPDGTRAYFVSTSALGGENPNGAVAQAGQQNLYLSEEGEVSFVATVTARDVEGEVTPNGARDGLGLWIEALAIRSPAADPSRLTPDGSVLLFQSRANLDGYDPEGEPQIYRFDSATDRLHCISCIPTRSSASRGASLQTFFDSETFDSPFLTNFDFVTNLTADGRRAFFESEEALVSTDTDDVKDVYEWEEQGVGSCTRADGCIYLISSGQSDQDNFLYAVSRSGDDVFFLTDDVLVPGDEDTISIYDARVNGGFPRSVATPCNAEGCRPGLATPPALSEPRTELAGTPHTRKECPRGKRRIVRRGKVLCVKKHRKHRRAAAKKEAGK